MVDDLVVGLVPVLRRSNDPEFNVFDVMHHGVHEKQISNVFRWLLDEHGSHGLGDRFVKIFVTEVNQTTDPPLGVDDGYWVRQEVNTAGSDDPADIADIVLEGRSSVIIVENYFTSDGHGHDYDRYLEFSQRAGKRGRVVLLCGEVMGHLLTQGWEDAAVVTYGELAERLRDEVRPDPEFQASNPDAYSFIGQIHRKFTQGDAMPGDGKTLDFVAAMCSAGEAHRYKVRPVEAATEQFASDLAERAREQFGAGRELMQRVKARLRTFSAGVLHPQLNSTLGEGFVRSVSANYAGIYQWTINFDTPSLQSAGMDGPLQIKFGPSAWYANKEDEVWRVTVEPSEVDYRQLFVARSGIHEIRQSSVSLQEVLAGLDPSDTRLRDELVSLVRS